MRVSVGGGAGRSVGAKIFGSLFYLVFFVAGLVLLVVFTRAWWQGARTYAWPRAECTVSSSGYASNPEADSSERYRATVRYRYEWHGEAHEGSVEKSFSDPGDAQAFRDRFAEGERVTCFVDDGSPEVSRLTRPSPFAILILLFPLVFVAAGGVPLWLTWRRPRASVDLPKPVPATALTHQAKGDWKGGCLLGGFFGIFFLVGLGILWWLMLAPLQAIARAKSWAETPCTVVTSGVASSSDSDGGTTYRVDVLYRYRFAGRDYESNRYDFQTASSSGYDAKQEIASRYPAGSDCTCFVDPETPSRAVLHRGFSRSYWAGLVGLPFLLAGMGGLLWLTGAFQREKKTRFPAQAVTFSDWRQGSEPVHLRRKGGPWKKLGTSLLVNLLWNGIVAVVVFGIVRSWKSGDHAWMPILIVTPFVLIGLLLLAGLPYSILALLNPRVSLDLDRGAAAPGETLGARFRLSGSASRLARLLIVLEGREAVTVTTRSNGSTSISTQESLFHRAVLYDSGPGGVVEDGAFTIALPAGTMHSFTSANNAVRWKIKVQGEIPRWPDLDQDFPFEVLPKEVRA